MRTMSVAALGLTTLALAACGGGGGLTTTTSTTTKPRHSETAGQFVVREQRDWAAGQYGRLWAILHPVQKKLVTAEQLANWADQHATGYPDPGNTQYRVKATYSEPWVVPGDTNKRPQPATAVTLQAVVPTELENGTPAPSVLWTDTSHAFRVGHHWVWILGENAFREINQDY